MKAEKTNFLGESRVQLGAPIPPRSRPTFMSCAMFLETGGFGVSVLASFYSVIL
jgi:hypothetical protein